MPHTSSDSIGERREGVSILIPAYKPQWFRECLESCLNQTAPVVEIVVSDDCPTDAVQAVAARHASDPRLRYVRNVPSLGLAANYLSLARQARGTWLKFLDDDDVLAPDGIERLVRHAREGVSLVMGGCLSVRENGDRTEKDERLPARTDGLAYLFERYRKAPITLFSRLLIRRDAFDALADAPIPARMISLDELAGVQCCLMGDIAWEPAPTCMHRDFSGGYSRNAEPAVLVDDLACIAIPVDRAIAMGHPRARSLAAWRNAMLVRFARGAMVKLISHGDWRGLAEFHALLRARYGALAWRSALSPRIAAKAVSRALAGASSR